MQTKQCELEDAAETRFGGCFRISFFLFSVFLPLITLVTELNTHMCAEGFFDPIPRYLNILLIALVPLGNFVLWRAISKGEITCFRRLSFINGLTLGTCLYYTILFLPLSILGVAMIPIGTGLLPIAPTFGLIGAIVCYRLFKPRVLKQSKQAALLGFGLSLALLFMAELPGAMTYHYMQGAHGGDAESMSKLRQWGDEEFVLNSCYLPSSHNLLLFGRIINFRHNFIDSHEARQLYYRMTGVPFNAVPPPDFIRPSFSRWDFDPERGSEQVGGRVKSLFLETSSVLCSVKPESSLAYTEWTFVYRNDGLEGAQEARMQLLLPPGGVVSRATLWVNGKEKEAAFASRAKAREAYESVVQRSQDPLLVTTCGPDRALVQCFPVPVGGGKMRIRLGITAPLHLNSLSDGVLPLPKMIERNFTFEGEHELKVVSAIPVSGSVTLTDNKANLSDQRLMETSTHLAVSRSASSESVYTSGKDGSFVLGHFTEAKNELGPSTLFVVDGSASAKNPVLELAKALPADAKVIFAGDRVLETTAGDLENQSFVGGQDGAPALEKALNLVEADGQVVWFHTSQPVELQFNGRIREVMKEHQNVRLHSFALKQGPNRVLEQMDGLDQVQTVVRQASVVEDLEKLLNTRKSWQMKTELRDESYGVEGSPHLSRLWAAKESERLWARGSEEEAAKLAVEYQLVTPASGAVVLETQEQYDENDLEPVEAGTVPTIPEPEVWILLLAALFTLVFVRRWKFAW